MLSFDDLLKNVNIIPSPNVNLELEVKFKPFPIYKAKEQYDRLLTHLRKNYTETIEESTMYSYPNDVRKIVTTHSTTYEQKKRLKDYKKYLDDYHFLISISEEKALGDLNINTKPLYIRKRLRHSFLVNSYRFDLTEIAGDKIIYEIELEYLGKMEGFDLVLLEEHIHNTYTIIYQSENYVKQSQIDALIKQYNDIFKVNPQKNISKFINPGARNIKFEDLTYGGIVGYKKDNEDEYYIAHKADGQDYSLILNDDGIWLVSKNTFNLIHAQPSTEPRELLIYRCEVMTDVVINDVLHYYYILMYDCIVYKNEDMRDNHITDRVWCIQPFIDIMVKKNTPNLTFKYKPIHLLTLDNFFTTIENLYNEQKTLEYPTDGFIFTPGWNYNYGTDKLPLSKRNLHDHPDICKWKPPLKITMDFRIVLENNIKLYVYDMYKKSEVSFTGSSSYPITDDMIDEDFNHMDYFDKIVECYYDMTFNKIRPLKIRHDKDGPNRLDISTSNWYDIHNPILIEDLTGKTLKLAIKYHNQVKNMLYGLPTRYKPLELTIPSNYNLLDIGGGRGGDLHRWSKSHVNKVVTVEPNNDNLKELKLRLADSDLKNRVVPVNTIGEDTVQITDKVMEVIKDKVDVISLMLSMSFFWASERHINALVRTIVHNLKLGGHVLFFTIYNKLEDELVENPLQLNDAKFTLYDDKYVRANIPGIVDKQWEFIVKINQLTLKLVQYGIVLKQKRVAKDELLLSKDGKRYSELFIYGYYEKIREVKLPKIRNIKLPIITYPTIIISPLPILENDQQEPIEHFIRIGCTNVLDAILKAFNKKYQENPADRVELQKSFREELAKDLVEDWATFNYQEFPKRLILQNKKVKDYTLLGLQYLFLHEEIPLELFNYIAFVIDMDICVFVNEENLTVKYTTFIGHQRDTILLLSINDHYELLINENKETYFNADFMYHINKEVKQIDIVTKPFKAVVYEVFGKSTPDLSTLYMPNDPIVPLILANYTDVNIYIKGLIKTIGKKYIIPKDFDAKLIKNKEDLKNILNDLRPLKDKPQRIEERIKNIIHIIATLNFNTYNMTVLDIGAGKGEIITAVKDYYQLPKENVYAIDQKLPNIKNITPLTYKNGTIPLPSQSVNVILLFAVLHHIPTKERLDLMKEIKRVLAPNGIIIVREHDDDKDIQFYNFIDLVHQFWYIVENESEDPLNMMSYDELLALFDGMKSVYHDYYNEPNPQHLYHEVFMFKYQDDFPYKKFSMDIRDVDRRFNNLKNYQFNFVHMPYTIRNIPGTWYQDPTKKYNNLIIRNEPEDYLKYNLIADYWMDPCRMQAKRYDQPLTPHEFWMQNKDLVYREAQKNYRKTDAYALRETIYKLAGEVTEFRPTIAVGLIKMFKAKRVLDPSFGWCNRLIGAMAMNVQYTGVDPNSCLHPKAEEMIQHFAKDPSKYIMIQSPFETAELPNKKYDLIMTSFPYWKLETYTNEETQSIHNRNLNEWFDDFLIFSMNKAWEKLEKGGHMCIIINDILNEANYCELMVNVFTDIHDDAEYLGVIAYSEIVKNKPKSPQPIWIFSKV